MTKESIDLAEHILECRMIMAAAEERALSQEGRLGSALVALVAGVEDGSSERQVPDASDPLTRNIRKFVLG